MKKLIEQPRVSVVRFEAKDVIATSYNRGCNAYSLHRIKDFQF